MISLQAGQTLTFQDRDRLLAELDRLDEPVPARDAGRNIDHREQFCIQRYLRFLAGGGLLPLPVTLTRTNQNEDPPDFSLRWADRCETFELTEGSTPQYQKELTEAARNKSNKLLLPVDINTPAGDAAQLWAKIIFSAFLRKSDRLEIGRYELDHLLIYDLTGLGLLVPLGQGGPLLRDLIRNSHRERAYKFKRVSILRDTALLLDVEGEGKILQQGSPYFQLGIIHAYDEEDLKGRLVRVDRFCRENSILHLKSFGSYRTGNRPQLREDSDLDLLVEFEPGIRVTLFDMARMERELGELIGIKVDLRTKGDLSRYFRQEVLEDAVELRATRR